MQHSILTNFLHITMHNNMLFTLTTCLFMQTYCYRKPSVPDDEEEKMQLSSKLLAFGVSIKDYMETLSQNEITP